MFTQARIKLTAWYLLIIMAISISFSVVIYKSTTFEIQRALSSQRFRIENPGEEFIFPRPERRIVLIDPEVLEEAKRRIFFRLLGINIIILITSGTAGFFLAGKTLKPIEKMLDEQKRFVADASHELRTPLTAMKTEIEVALRNKKLNLRESKNLIDSNFEEVNKMQSLSNHLLSLSRYQDSTFQFVFKKIQLAKITKEVKEKVISLAKEKNILVLIEGNAELVANPESIMELATILLDNAIKYSYEKGTINIKINSDNKYATLKVQDNGIGIETEKIPYIFNRFYRADSSHSKDRAGGYGLGLSIAKQIVDNHHGSINVESSKNNGSTFIVRLPLKQTKIRI